MRMAQTWLAYYLFSLLGATLTIAQGDYNLRHVFKFTRPLYNVTIPENSVGKAFVIPSEKMGVYRGDEDLDVRFKIVSGDKDRDKFFKAEEKLVGDFWFLLLRTRTGTNDVLNRERKDRYVLGIKATATRRDGKRASFAEAETTVIVNILDVNDLNPLFYPTEYEETVAEDTPLHKSILRVFAEDADLGRNGEIYYSFQEITEQFAIHPTTGIVTLTRPLRYSEKAYHELTVLGQDRGAVLRGGGKPSTARLRISVKQVNLFSPVIDVHHLPDIAENSNANIYAIVKVYDQDDGIHGEIRSLDIVDGDPNGHFRIRLASGPEQRTAEFNIEVLKLLDRESSPMGYNLTLRAIDRGIPPKHTYKSVPVHLADLNDNPPIFDREIYEVDVPESAPVNSPIIRLKVTDADQGKNAMVFLEIVGGNEGDEFVINPDTGMLYTNAKLDAEEKSLYTLTVTAIDQGNAGTRKQSSAKVLINIVDANDNDPLFETCDIEVGISENVPIGTSVTKVVAKDKDSGENAYISYSTDNLNAVPFEIDHFTGVVRTSQVLDYESMRRQFVLRIRASDWGLPFRRQAEMQMKINVKDVNDNRPQFEKVDCFGQISRFLPIASEIIILSAMDFDAGSIISYKIVSGNEDGCFSLDITSGEVTVTCDLSDVAVNERELNVTATDGTHYADINTIRMKLVNNKKAASTDRYLSNETGGFECRDTGVTKRLTEVLIASERSNSMNRGLREEFAMMPSRYGENIHSPEFNDFPNHIQVNESKPIGSSLIRIRAKDRDLGYNGKLTYGISSGDQDSVFRIDPDSGELKVIGYLDRERQTEYILNITVYDQGKPQKSSSRMLPITVLDVNDNPPKFRSSLASFRVSENAHNGTNIFRVNATDADEGENANIQYSLVTDTEDFHVHPITGILYVAGPLDRERQEIYELVIRATDCASRPGDVSALHSDSLIRVIVDDVNDNPPTFSMPSYSVKAREDVPLGSVVAILSATDPDLGAGGDIRYLIRGETENDEGFTIDHLTGTIRVSKPLDFEERQVHSLIVLAKDRGIPSLSSEVTLIVEVVDVNENLHAPTFEDFVVAASVPENQPIGTLVTTVKATDADPPGDDSTIGYSVKGGDGLGYFSIDHEGNIRTLSFLDAETKSHYWLTVVAQDHGVVPLHSRIEVFVSVSNVNDNVPLTLEPVYYPFVPENSPAGTSVIHISAWDLDAQSLSFRITSGNPESFFSIDSQTGLITTTGRMLDRENQAEHILEVTVTDDGIPPLSSTTRVVVTVKDVNDNAPEFQEPYYHFLIPETRHHESPLFQVVAFDKDEGRNADLFYEIMSGRGKGKFGIHPKSGVVYSQKSFVSGQEYDLLVRATDNGIPNKTSITRVSVQVMPLPEDSTHPPTVRTPDQHVEVHESDTVGFLVTLVQSEDKDGDLLWYRIIDGDPRSEFVISSDKGSILLAHQLNWEVQNNYNLSISISDGIYTVYTQVYVTVVDINEHRPVFSKPLYTTNVSESIPVGSEIIRLAANDKDQDRKILFSLHSARSPSSVNLFKVDYQTGAITIAQPLDRETISEHILTVMAKDQGTPAKRNYVRAIIQVYDANDHTPEFSMSLIQGRVFETSPVGTTIMTLYAIDKDHGENAAITYSISSGNVGNAFTLDPELGTLHVARELDLTSMTEYMLIVKAADSGSPSLSGNVPVHIMVVMADNAPPRFARREVAAEMYENEPPGMRVKQLEARSTSSLHYELASGNINNSFNINPTTGVIYTNTRLDFEKIKVYNLSVTATNMAGAKAMCNVVVHILDRNDNTPYFLEHSYTGWVSEDSPIGSLILSNESSPLVISAFDEDSQLNSLFQFEIIEPMSRRMFHIDSTTGVIRTIVTLDYESQKSIRFHVRVSDLGKPKLSSDVLAEVVIHINDSNDCAPVFSQSEYNGSILIPTYPNIAVVELNATDADSPSLTKLIYSIVTGNSGNIYSIDSESGVIHVHNSSRGSRTSPQRLKVSVTDGKYYDEAYVNIHWEHSHDSGLTFQRPVYHGVVKENSTKILTVVVVSVIGSHLNEHLMFSILSPSPLFTIGLTSGALRTTGIRFDREKQEFYQLIIQARSGDTREGEVRVAHVPVNITVLDINDNCPMFVNLPYYAVVSIDAHKGDVITKVHAIDLDKGENGEVRYELIKGHGELFKVCRKTGEVTLKRALEGHNKEYKLTIAAYDGGTTPCSTEVPVVVKVMDRSMPVFDQQFYTVTTSEDNELYSALPVSIQAESPLGRKLIYSLTNGNDYEKFAIDFNTAPDGNNGPCALYVIDELDYETQQEYALTVRATDSVSGVYAEVLVSLLVTDVNDCAPEFPVDSYNVTVSEGALFGSVILRVIATDNDTDLNNVVRYSLDPSQNASEYFHVDPDDGSIYLKRSLDHELQTSHHLLVIASDNGIPKLSTSVHIWITVLDMNDNPPKLEQGVYTCWLSEEVTRGQFVTIISASDPDVRDQANLAYSIVGGNQQQTFSMDPKTGMITVTNLHKLTETRTHTLNVSVSDGVYTSFARVRVEILPANKHSPQFDKHQYEVKVLENIVEGGKILRVRAVDKDSGPYGIVTYSITSSLLSETFEINNITGEIFVKSSLDREKQKIYELSVIGQDAGGKSGFTNVRIWVLDVNDNPPVFILPEYKVCIPSNLTVGLGFLKVKAIDSDEDQSGQVSYSIYDRDLSGVRDIFEVNRFTGTLSLTKSALPHENQIYQFFVRASDHGNPTLHADVPVHIFVMSSGDIPPIFERRDDKVLISETAPVGTMITKVKLVVDMPVNFKLLTRESLFTIDATGKIFLSGNLDREKSVSHTIGVLAFSDSSPPLTAITEINLRVLDFNDNAPYFHSSYYSLAVAENIEERSPLLKVQAGDLDEGANGDIRFSISGSGSEAFTIDTHTGWISTMVPLDRETYPSYKFSVIASDSGTPPLSSNTSLHLTLVDYNDNPPRFSQSSYVATVNEGALPGTVVQIVSVSDLDIDNGNIEYYITAGDPRSQFDVRSTGEVYVSQALDREVMDKYELILYATDGKFIAVATLLVDILDANDQQPYCIHYRYKEKVSEGAPPGTYILTIQAIDLDLDPKLKFYLIGEGAEYFNLDRTTGELKTAKPLDRETIAQYHLTAHVQDREHSDWQCISHIEIVLIDLNDNIPVFPSSNFTASIPEDAEVGSLVTKVHATDDDIGVNRKIKYVLVNSANGHFSITSDSGIVTLSKQLDRETQATYNLTVKAIDQGVPQLWSVSSIIVLVLDVNDNPPEFVSRSYHTLVPESASIDTEVGRVMATSLDTGINAAIEYSIVGGNEHGKFSIDSKTGTITIAQPLDYERAHDYLLTVQATDLGVPPLSNQASVNITVVDSNDNAPVFSQLSYLVKIRENVEVGTLVTQITAMDLDSGINGKVEYLIKSGDKHNQFAIDSESGHVTVTRPLDREMIPSYNLQIQASDHGTPEMSNYAVLNIEIEDVNDNPPLFTQSNYTVIVQEDKRTGWSVCQLLVTDADIPPNTGPFSFDLLPGQGRNAFRIEPDGTLKTAALLSHKLQDTYSLHVRVFDNGTPPMFSDTWVIVKVIEESQYPPTVTPLDIWVRSYQERWIGGELGRVHATDQDQYDRLIFDIVSVQPAALPLFSIDLNHGVISANSQLDSGYYILNISVTDGKYTTYGNVKVTVEALWDEMLENAYSVRLPGITPHNFILTQRKGLLKGLKLALLHEVSIISIQDTGHGDIDVLISVKGGVDVETLNSALMSVNLPVIQLSCQCLNGGLCRQRINIESERVLTIATDISSFVAPAHTHDLYCACNLGFTGDRCEEPLPQTICECPPAQTCIPQPGPPGFVCSPPSPASPLCSLNHTCSPPESPLINTTLFTLSWQHLMTIAAISSILVLFCIIILLCRFCRHKERDEDIDKTVPMLNSDMKRSSKLSNLEVTQPPRPASYTSGSNNEVFTGQLNNLDTVRSYGSAGDELENVPPDYVKNLNRNGSSPGHKINNDLKRIPELPARGTLRSLSVVEDDARMLGGYHWDCSDWVRPSQNPLPNITEVPGSEVPDSSSFHSNDSNDSNIHHHNIANVIIDPARDLATLDEELYMTYRSEDDDVIPYGFPRSYLSHSDISTNLCDIEDSDVPT